MRMTDTLITTMMLLKAADSLIPTTSNTVMMATIIMAGTLRTAPVLVQPSVNSRQIFQPASGGAAWLKGAAVNCPGITIPNSLRNDTTYSDQPTATVDAANRYSRIRSH